MAPISSCPGNDLSCAVVVKKETCLELNRVKVDGETAQRKAYGSRNSVLPKLLLNLFEAQITSADHPATGL